ncbi:hypothetical protein QC762_0031180 [Podospora pseudocomata]|uniref:Uncharacterized protein n=1 Tax=Podospora pseudocomata TaxID=2093779 RepID=A0ABR0GQ26_9PEZI|nr:hypothetical protein QC762_0031180 [Podospora pseudocomata]
MIRVPEKIVPRSGVLAMSLKFLRWIRATYSSNQQREGDRRDYGTSFGRPFRMLSVLTVPSRLFDIW